VSNRVAVALRDAGEIESLAQFPLPVLDRSFELAPSGPEVELGRDARRGASSAFTTKSGNTVLTGTPVFCV
jgi:hypothetical protein